MKCPNASRVLGLLALGWSCLDSAFALEANEIFKRVDPSVVVIGVEGAKPSDAKFGSGVIVEALDVITSCHVVSGATRITVKQGSVQRSAKLRYQDAARDLCQIHLDDIFPSGKPVSGYAKSKELEVGQSVFAIGSPRGLEHTISRGIVSALRELKEEAGNLIQTDAAVSPGSSGGGLFDAEGRLIGIVTFQFKDAQNLNFAIPADWVLELTKRNRDRLSDVQQSDSVQRGGDKTAPDAAVSGLLRVGDRWKYRLIDGRRAVGTVVVEIVDVRGKAARERITRENERGFQAEREVEVDLNSVKFRDVVSLPGGYQLTEMSPYIPPGQEIRVGQNWQGLPVTLLLAGYGYGKQRFETESRVVGREKVRVPAGTFDAIHVQTTAQKNLGSDLIRVFFDYWYNQESVRTVKMSLEIKYSNTAFQSNSEIYELMAFEPAK